MLRRYQTINNTISGEISSFSAVPACRVNILNTTGYVVLKIRKMSSMLSLIITARKKHKKITVIIAKKIQERFETKLFIIYSTLKLFPPRTSESVQYGKVD